MMLFALTAGSGLLIAALGFPLWKRKVAPNHLYGLRVPATMNDPDVWYEANARSGFYMIAAGATIALVAFVVYAFGVPAATATWINISVLLVAVTVMCVGSVRLASRLEREARSPSRSAT